MTERFECLEQAVPCRGTSNVKYPVAELSPGTRHNKVAMGCRVKGGSGGDSCNRHAQILEVRWCKSIGY